MTDRTEACALVGDQNQVGAVWRGDGLAGEVGVEGGDDGGHVGAVGVDHGEVAGAGVVLGHEVQRHDDRGGVIDGEGLLVVGGVGGCPPDVDAVGSQVVVGARVPGLLQALVEEHPDVHPTGGVRGQVRFGRGVGQLVHGQVNRGTCPGDELVDRSDPGRRLGQQPQRRGGVRCCQCQAGGGGRRGLQRRAAASGNARAQPGGSEHDQDLPVQLTAPPRSASPGIGLNLSRCSCLVRHALEKAGMAGLAALCPLRLRPGHLQQPPDQQQVWCGCPWASADRIARPTGRTRPAVSV